MPKLLSVFRRRSGKVPARTIGLRWWYKHIMQAGTFYHIFAPSIKKTRAEKIDAYGCGERPVWHCQEFSRRLTSSQPLEQIDYLGQSDGVIPVDVGTGSVRVGIQLGGEDACHGLQTDDGVVQLYL